VKGSWHAKVDECSDSQVRAPCIIALCLANCTLEGWMQDQAEAVDGEQRHPATGQGRRRALQAPLTVQGARPFSFSTPPRSQSIMSDVVFSGNSQEIDKFLETFKLSSFVAFWTKKGACTCSNRSLQVQSQLGHKAYQECWIRS
jgi:hypothetical protein